jgi:hypothetical protein
MLKEHVFEGAQNDYLARGAHMSRPSPDYKTVLKVLCLNSLLLFRI